MIEKTLKFLFPEKSIPHIKYTFKFLFLLALFLILLFEVILR